MSDQDGLNSIIPAILAIVFTGLVITIGITIFTEFGDAVRTDAVVVNESLSASRTYADFANTHVTTTNIVITNTSNAVVLNSSMFEYDNEGSHAARRIRLTDAGSLQVSNGSNINATYTHGAASAPTTVLTSAGTSLDDFVQWWPIIIIVIITGIILVILVKSFKR